ncbi:MAG: hypothetical protein H7224_04275 [Polaromonas sp.]|nr:hypothetical protein [Polaromonas sp.]
MLSAYIMTNVSMTAAAHFVDYKCGPASLLKHGAWVCFRGDGVKSFKAMGRHTG